MWAVVLGAVLARRGEFLRKLFEGDSTAIVILVIAIGIVVTIGIVKVVRSNGSAGDDERPLKKKKKRPRDDDDEDDDGRPRKRRPQDW